MLPYERALGPNTTTARTEGRSGEEGRRRKEIWGGNLGRQSGQAIWGGNLGRQSGEAICGGNLGMGRQSGGGNPGEKVMEEASGGS